MIQIWVLLPATLSALSLDDISAILDKKHEEKMAYLLFTACIPQLVFPLICFY